MRHERSQQGASRLTLTAQHQSVNWVRSHNPQRFFAPDEEAGYMGLLASSCPDDMTLGDLRHALDGCAEAHLMQIRNQHNAVPERPSYDVNALLRSASDLGFYSSMHDMMRHSFSNGWITAAYHAIRRTPDCQRRHGDRSMWAASMVVQHQTRLWMHMDRDGVCASCYTATTPKPTMQRRKQQTAAAEAAICLGVLSAIAPHEPMHATAMCLRLTAVMDQAQMTKAMRWGRDPDNQQLMPGIHCVLPLYDIASACIHGSRQELVSTQPERFLGAAWAADVASMGLRMVMDDDQRMHAAGAHVLTLIT